MHKTLRICRVNMIFQLMHLYIHGKTVLFKNLARYRSENNFA